MMDALIIPLLVTTDLPPATDVAEFGRVVAGAVRTLERAHVTYPGHLHGKTFWLDPPAPPPTPGDGPAARGLPTAEEPVSPEEPVASAGGAAASVGDPVASVEELRFAALLGFLSVAVPHGLPGGARARVVVADARAAITAAVTARYGDLGSAPAVMSIRADDVRERTPDTATPVETAPPVPELAAATRSYL